MRIHAKAILKSLSKHVVSLVRIFCLVALLTATPVRLASTEPGIASSSDAAESIQKFEGLRRLIENGEFSLAKKRCLALIDNEKASAQGRVYAAELDKALQLSEQDTTRLVRALRFVDLREDPLNPENARRYASENDFATCKELLGNASAIAALSRQSLAVQLLRTKEFQEAFRHAESSWLTLSEIQRDSQIAGFSLYLMGECQHQLGNHRLADQYFHKYSLTSDNTPPLATIVRCLLRRGVFKRRRNASNFWKIHEEAYEKAKLLPTSMEYLQHEATFELAFSHFLGAQAGFDGAEADRAKQLATQLLRSRGESDDLLTLKTMELLSMYWTQANRPRKALLTREKQLNIESRVFGQLSPQATGTLCNIARRLCRFGEQAAAIQRISPVHKACLRSFGKADFRVLRLSKELGAAYLQLQLNEEAEAVLSVGGDVPERIRGRIEMQQAVNATIHATTLANLGHNVRATEKLTSIKEVLSRDVGTSHDAYLNAAYVLAGIRRATGQIEQAEKDYKSVLQSFALNRRTRDVARTLVDLGVVKFRQEKIEQSRQYFEMARRQVLDSTFQSTATVKDRDEINPFIYLSALSILDSNSTQAWEHREFVSAPELMRLLRDSDPLGHAQAEQSFLPLGPSAELTKTSNEKRGMYPGSTFSVKHIQSLLAANEAMICWLGCGRLINQEFPNGVWAGCVLRSTGKPDWVLLPGYQDPNLNGAQLMGDARIALSDPNSDWKTVTEQVFRLKLKPLLPKLAATKHLPAVEKLIVIPTAVMDGVPIEVLMTHAPTDHPGFSVAYSPSASVWAWLVQRSVNGNRPVNSKALVIGDPAIPDLRLPGAQATANMIRESVSESTVLLGQEASKRKLWDLRSRLAEYSLVHLATHVTVEPLLPLESTIHLAHTSDPETGATVGGSLSGLEIAEWKLRAELVTLSACRSALGRRSYTEGIQGLTHPFLIAGAESVIASHWDVNDAAASLIMSRFYRQLLTSKDSIDKSRCLDSAKQWLRNLAAADVEQLMNDNGLSISLARGGLESAGPVRQGRPFEHPYYWAPLIYFGP